MQLQRKFAREFSAHQLPKLTPREKDILYYLSHGLTNTEIMAQLGISFSTVRTHINNILAKFNAHNITHACVLALHMGLLD